MMDHSLAYLLIFDRTVSVTFAPRRRAPTLALSTFQDTAEPTFAIDAKNAPSRQWHVKQEANRKWEQAPVPSPSGQSSIENPPAF